MMPSHSMDLPVPRGTSMLMLGGKVHIIWYKNCNADVLCLYHVVSMFSMTSFCFSPDGKSPFTCCESQAASQITLNDMFFVGLLVASNAAICILTLSLTRVLNLYSRAKVNFGTHESNSNYLQLKVRCKSQHSVSIMHLFFPRGHFSQNT